ADATVLWGESFILTGDQQAGAAESIADSLATALRSRFPKSIAAAPIARRQTPSNPEAFRLYLRAQFELDNRKTSVRESADFFRRAIREDTLFGRSYSGLSLALAFYPHFQKTPPSVVHDELVKSARRALAIDSTLAQPHIALGMDYQFHRQWDLAATEFQKAIQLDRHDVDARVQYGRYLRNRGRWAQSMSEFKAARAEDPSSSLVLG